MSWEWLIPILILLEGVERSQNIVTCDAHDLEVALICSPAFDRVLVEFGSAQKIKLLGTSARDLVLFAARAVGYLRWMSARNQLGLKFQGLKLTSCVNRDSLQIDRNKLSQNVINLSKTPELSASQLLEAADALTNTRHDLCHVCCGDDAVQVLSIGLRQLFGTNRAKDVTVERLKQSLRLAFEEADFRRSALGRSIGDWERRNRGYGVVRT